jgi:hypothetical protein
MELPAAALLSGKTNKTIRNNATINKIIAVNLPNVIWE